MAPRWRKVLRDLWGNKTRTALVVLSIAVGVFALGMILSTTTLLDRDLPVAYNEINPAHAEIYTELFDTDLLEVVEDIEGVEAAAARREFRVRLLVDEQNEEWTNMSLTFFPDIENIDITKVHYVSGKFPPGEDEILIERSSIPYVGADIGDKVTIETRNGRQREVTIVGVMHNLNIEPTQFTRQPNAYTGFEMLDWLGEAPLYDELHLRVANDTAGPHPSAAYVKETADAVRNKIEKGGREVYWIWQPTPGEHPATEPVNAILYILGVLGGFSLFLSGFLVVNIINSILAQQVRQIGIMKAVGARSDQVFSMYIITVLVFGMLSLFIAVPLGSLAGYAFAVYLANLINFDLAGFYLASNVVLIQVGVGVAIPILAALVPVIRGARVSVREAISDRGVGKGQFGTHIVDRTMSWFTTRILRLSRPMSISLRNTIRRKARLALTLFTLILGGAIFISVTSVYESLMATMDDALSYFNYDVTLDFNKQYRIEEIYWAAEQVDGVEAAESWIGESTRIVKPDGTESNNLFMLGVPPTTATINPDITDGRWITDQDERGIVINSAVLQEVGEDLQVGDKLTLKLEGDETEWVIVGIARSVLIGPIMYVNQDALAREVGRYSQSAGVQIIANAETPEEQAALAKVLQDHYEQLGIEVTSTETISQIREGIITQFNIIVVLMTVMAILIAAVGGLGLMGTMSINVLERTREIGVIRAVGASDGSVLRIVLVEGIFIGIVSWLVSALVSIPLGQWIARMVGINLMQSPLTYEFAVWGMFLWIAVVLTIAALASLLPARNASRLSVRETLAYE